MPVFDPERRCLVVRVVYDGPAFAGKTTNVQRLMDLFPVEKRSELYTPGAMKGRTMFFDWLEVEAGRVGQTPLRCQVLTVPGQGQRSYRRKPLLQSADGVVFVCDSARGAIAETKKTFSQLKAQLRLRRPQSVPMVVQANKQDAESALLPEQISGLLRLSETVSVLGASAHTSVGVRETFVTAVKAAVREVHTRIANEGWDAITGEAESADALLDTLLQLEENEDVVDTVLPEASLDDYEDE